MAWSGRASGGSCRDAPYERSVGVAHVFGDGDGVEPAADGSREMTQAVSEDSEDLEGEGENGARIRGRG